MEYIYERGFDSEMVSLGMNIQAYTKGLRRQALKVIEIHKNYIVCLNKDCIRIPIHNTELKYYIVLEY